MLIVLITADQLQYYSLLYNIEGDAVVIFDGSLNWVCWYKPHVECCSLAAHKSASEAGIIVVNFC